MGQFSVYPNTNHDTRGRIPWLLDVQSPLLDDMATRLVIPLCRAAAMEGAIIHQLMPVLNIKGHDYVLLTPQMAGIPKRLLKRPAADLSPYRSDILAAIDLLVVGF